MRLVVRGLVVFSLLAPGGSVVAIQAAPAEEVVPAVRWAAPLYWQPAGMAAEKGAEAESVPSLPTSAMPFVAITPCRLIDTRGLTSPTPPYPLPPGYGSDNPLVAAGTADWVVAGASHCTVPSGARAVSVNVTVLGYTADGYLTAYPTDVTQPVVATLNWRSALSTAQNAGVLELSAAGSVRVYALAFTKMVVDVNGYYAPASTFCLGGDCRTSWNNQDASSVSPQPRTCPTGQIAVSTGTYSWACSDACVAIGLTACWGACKNLQNDAANCGNCGIPCSTNHATPICSAGACQLICAPGWGDCDFSVSTGCETNLRTSSANCGTCNNACATGHSCVSGVCI